MGVVPGAFASHEAEGRGDPESGASLVRSDELSGMRFELMRLTSAGPSLRFVT